MEIKNLYKAFGSKVLYENLNVRIKKGEIFALIGPNGVGKTSLMKLILGWDKDYRGQIIFDDKERLSYSPESPAFPDFLTGRELLEFFTKIRKSGEDVQKVMDLVGLDFENKEKIKNYSKGMKQRLGVAQALLGNPSILLFDEPTAGLDYFGQREMAGLFMDLKKQGKTIILNSHLLLDVEKICDEGLLIMGPKLSRSFSKEDLSKKSLGDMFMDLAYEKARKEGKDGRIYFS